MYDNRIKRLRKSMRQKGITSFLITKPENIYYLTGFTGTNGSVLLTQKKIILITDFRYDEQAREQSPHTNVHVSADGLVSSLCDLYKSLDLSVLAVEGDYVTHHFYQTLVEKLKQDNVCSVLGMVEEIRIVKDIIEIKKLADSALVSDRAMEHVFPLIKEGVSERELSLEIEFFFKRNGAEGLAFNMIVASGYRSAMPHGTATSKKLQNGELLTMDFGALLKGYNSDITRTVAVGSKDSKMEDIYKIVLEAQLAGLNAVREGVTASEVDKASREVIKYYGYGDNFGHSTGHGVGLEIHEKPSLSAMNNTILLKGMVVTVEPGIYLPGWGGVRIEDTVVVEENGCRLLTSTKKESLMVLGN